MVQNFYEFLILKVLQDTGKSYMGRDDDLKTRSFRKDDGSSNIKCSRSGRRPEELQPDNEVWTLSKRQEDGE